MRFNKAMPGDDLGAQDDSKSTPNRRRVILPVLLVVVILIAGVYVVYTYEQSVAQVTVVTGKIAQIQLPSSEPGAPPAAGGLGGQGQGPVPGAGGSPLTYVVISIGSSSITQALPCSTVPFAVGQTVKVADEQLRDGSHHFFPDVACRGQASPFQGVHFSSTTSSSSTSTQ